mmetsp:Transcript_27808/g.55687  ORF Transcript_27808/g.55687 Transcript_27808/m.55687 type:complete len:368 (-) Transcript_27808:97-1200(-)
MARQISRRRPRADPDLARRLADFKFARNERREKYGDRKPIGIFGLYEHLHSVRVDMEWAEDLPAHEDELHLSWYTFDEKNTRAANRPFVTYAAIAICTAMLMVSLWRNGGIEPFSTNLMIGPSAETLIALGARQSQLIVVEREGWRLLAPMFLHAGIVHYVLNMIVLWFVGGAVERSHGSPAVFIIFSVAAVGGNILSAICLPQYISVGASGGIFGLIGACVADIVVNWSVLFGRYAADDNPEVRSGHVKILIWLAIDILINAAIGLTPLIDNFTHLGGAVYGFLCGFSTMDRLPVEFFGVKQTSCGRFRQYINRTVGLVVSAGAIMASTTVLLEGDGINSPCPRCSIVSCIPFPPWRDENNKWWYC